MRYKSWARVVVFISASLLLFGLTGTAGAQSIPQVPGLSAASNDRGCTTGSSGIPVSSAIFAPLLPKIPNLEFGFLYYFGKNVRTGRFTADYVLPLRLSADSVVFGEAHAEGWNFWKRSSGTADNRIDLSFGGGYRTMLGDNTFVGVNGFYDTTRLFNQWHSSGGVGLEYAANVSGSDAVDLNFNWYGNLFNRDSLINAFRNKGNSFDVEAGYSHALFNQSMDLRFKIIGYQFDIGDKVYGWRGGADLTTRDGMFTLRYEHGSDRLNGDYNTVGGFVTVGLQVENLLSGESPFTLPEPVFRSPRDLRRLLGLKVKRNWHQPAAVVAAKSQTSTSTSTSTIVRYTLTGPFTWAFNTYLFSGLIPAGANVAYSTWTLRWDNCSTNTGAFSPILMYDSFDASDAGTAGPFTAGSGGEVGPFNTRPSGGGGAVNGVRNATGATVIFPAGTTLTLVLQ